jgi:hypothetical protein
MVLALNMASSIGEKLILIGALRDTEQILDA